MIYLREKIALLMECLDKDELDYKIAQYITYHPYEVLDLSVREFAKKVYVSPPAIVRFVSRLGIEDYKKFKSLLNDGLLNNQTEMKIASKNSYKKIDRLLDEIDESILLEFVNVLRSAKRICFHGKGIYLQIFLDLFEMLRVEGKVIVNLSSKNSSMKREVVETLDEDDVVILFFPGRDVYEMAVTHQRIEFDFITTLESKKCNKFFFGQVLSNYPKQYAIVKIPKCENESMYQILSILLKEKIKSLYFEVSKRK